MTSGCRSVISCGVMSHRDITWSQMSWQIWICTMVTQSKCFNIMLIFYLATLTFDLQPWIWNSSLIFSPNFRSLRQLTHRHTRDRFCALDRWHGWKYNVYWLLLSHMHNQNMYLSIQNLIVLLKTSTINWNNPLTQLNHWSKLCNLFLFLDILLHSQLIFTSFAVVFSNFKIKALINRWYINVLKVKPAVQNQPIASQSQMELLALLP